MSERSPDSKPLSCLRCGNPLVYRGKRYFQVAEAAPAFGAPPPMAMHTCRDCGHVELFIDPEPDPPSSAAR